jgi:hypothetical protein
LRNSLQCTFFSLFPNGSESYLPKRRTSTTPVCKLPLQPNLTGCSLKIHLRAMVWQILSNLFRVHTPLQSRNKFWIMELSRSTSSSDSSIGDQSVAPNTHTITSSHSSTDLTATSYIARHRIQLRTFFFPPLALPTDGAADDTASFFAALANTSDSTLVSTIAIQQRLAQDVSSSSTFVPLPLVPPRLSHRVEQQLRNLQNLHKLSKTTRDIQPVRVRSNFFVPQGTSLTLTAAIGVRGGC